MSNNNNSNYNFETNEKKNTFLIFLLSFYIFVLWSLYKFVSYSSYNVDDTTNYEKSSFNISYSKKIHHSIT